MSNTLLQIRRNAVGARRTPKVLMARAFITIVAVFGLLAIGQAAAQAQSGAGSNPMTEDEAIGNYLVLVLQRIGDDDWPTQWQGLTGDEKRLLWLLPERVRERQEFQTMGWRGRSMLVVNSLKVALDANSAAYFRSLVDSTLAVPGAQPYVETVRDCSAGSGWGSCPNTRDVVFPSNPDLHSPMPEACEQNRWVFNEMERMADALSMTQNTNIAHVFQGCGTPVPECLKAYHDLYFQCYPLFFPEHPFADRWLQRAYTACLDNPALVPVAQAVAAGTERSLAAPPYVESEVIRNMNSMQEKRLITDNVFRESVPVEICEAIVQLAFFRDMTYAGFPEAKVEAFLDRSGPRKVALR